MLLQYMLLVVSLFTLANALSETVIIKRQIVQLRPSYDFVIAGGGTTGLTVADRLSEAFPNKTVLVVEYGEIEYAPGVFDPPAAGGQGGALGQSFSFTSLPQPDIKNKSAFVLAGKIVGGSSAVNGMFFDRGSRFDYDAWAQAGSPDFDNSTNKWDWQGLFPYFKKSVTFTTPSNDVAQKYGYKWDPSAYGGSTPIYSTFPPFQWADHHIVRNTWKEVGIRESSECAGGDKDGLCWVPNSQHPVTARRSHAGLGHYGAVNTTRSNYDLLVKHQVVRVVYTNGTTSRPPIVELRSLADDRLFNVSTKAEVVISAGALHTPTILQRSGIGSASFLRDVGIPVVLDLPGVGSNLQDHSGPGLSWNYTKPGNFSPVQSDMLDPTFAADAAAGFNEAPARGPYTLAMSNSAIFTSLPNMTANYSNIISKIHTMSNGSLATSYLPKVYNSSPALLAGYTHQLSLIAEILQNSRAPSLEVPFSTGSSIRAIMLHPLSRGTVRIDPKNHIGQPILDYRTGSNPIDFDLHLAHLKFLRKMFDTTTMQTYGAVEVAPGAEIQSDNALVEYVKQNMVSSFMHPCCTAAMMPAERGGVVGPSLQVHSAKGLRVVDMSILPLLPSSHLSATAYAVGEKAADIIIADTL